MSPLMMKLLGRVYMSEVDEGGGGGGDVSAPAPTAEAPAPAAESSVLTPPAPADAPAPKPDDAKPDDASKPAEAYQAAVTKQAQDWAASIKNDPEIGGENYDKSVASAIKVIQSFGDPALTELLNTSGLGNHPALFKFCHRISAAISEDKFVMPGSQTNAPKEMSIIDAFK